MDLEQSRDAALLALIDSVPYYRFLEIEVERLGDELTTHLPFRQKFVGNPFLPAIHGGIMGAFLEVTAQIQLGWLQVSASDTTTPDQMDRPHLPSIPKTIDATIDYLRSARPQETFARAIVQKAGRRVVHIHVTAWQDERDRPIASMRGNFLMPS